jgi:thioester reductase-like protein
MPLNVKLDVVNGQYTMLLSDVTGDYNATTNPDGWGAPNTARSAVTGLACTVLRPGQTVANTITGLFASTFWTAAYRQVDIFTQLPTVPDGLYTVTLTFTSTPSIPVEIMYFLRYEAAKATLAQLALQDNSDFEQLKFIYDKMVLAEDFGNYTLAQTLLDEFNSVVAGCGNTGLSGGCGC